MTPETVSGIIRQAAKQLALRGVESPALDSRLLMQAVAGLSHEDIVAEPDLILSPETVSAFWHLIERRAAFEPVSRILGRREFYGRAFRLTPDVLDPRADTEILVDAALSLARGKSLLRILDLGTGSGAIAITLLSELPHASGVATDVSREALAVATANAQNLGVADRLQLIESNWFDGVDGLFDLVISNPPYIARGDIAGLAADVREFDPPLALVGGMDGLEAYRAIAIGALAFLATQGHVLVEIGAGQENDVQDLFVAHGFALIGSHRDLAGHIRCLCFGQV
jgi:release factor glutamine methyltransferase